MAANSTAQSVTNVTSDSPDGDWRGRLYHRLRGNPYPLFVFSDCILPAATIWSGARLWAKAFRESGMAPGDRIALALAPSPAFLQVLVAAIWENLTIGVLPPGAGETEAAMRNAMDDLDAVAGVAREGNPPASIWQATVCSGPSQSQNSVRPMRFVREPDARFLLKTSGTTSKVGKWIALSDANVLSVLDSHLPHLGYVERQSRILSILPWHHCFGLVMDLLPALLSGAEIVRDPSNGRSPEALIALGREMGSEYLSAVPMSIKRIYKTSGGAEFLRNLKGGIVGGAPVDSELTRFLRTTRLRAGYGQTEASPGIALGMPGYWPESQYLGQALGCTVKANSEGILTFRGSNACLGYWTAETGLERLDPERDVQTGDVVDIRPGGDLFFRGRADDIFKLANGRAVEAGCWESRILAEFPQVSDALLWSPDGETLHLLFHANAVPPDLSDLQRLLAALGPRLTHMAPLAEEQWVRTPKGIVDRAATVARWQARKEMNT